MSMPQAPEKAVPVLYLDLDGTVRQGKDDALGRFVNGPEDVAVFPEAVEMMRRWKAGGGRVIGVSNQGGVALGIVAYAKVAAAMRETLVGRPVPVRQDHVLHSPSEGGTPGDGPLLVPQAVAGPDHRGGA